MSEPTRIPVYMNRPLSPPICSCCCFGTNEGALIQHCVEMYPFVTEKNIKSIILKASVSNIGISFLSFSASIIMIGINSDLNTAPNITSLALICQIPASFLPRVSKMLKINIKEMVLYDPTSSGLRLKLFMKANVS